MLSPADSPIPCGLKQLRVQPARDEKIADRIGAALTEVAVLLFVTDAISVSAYLEMRLDSQPLAGLKAGPDFLRQPGKRRETFRGKLIFVGQEIDKRTFDDGL